MKKSFIACLLLVVSTCIWAQSDDPIVMRINGKPVPRSEFEYNFNKNNTDGVVDKKSVTEYAELFANYKLKVEAALDDKLDTLSSFQKEFRSYRDQQIRPMLVPQSVVEDECRAYYDNMVKQLDGHDLVQPAHIFLRVSQTATKEEQEAAKVKIDSLYKELQGGEETLHLLRDEPAKTISAIAAEVGFTPANLREQFKRKY
ncbi:MAG: peptidylprolyl isomerase, partial [Bacteroidaceae bacterium]|nr:peptidylprolyl isomerase [Bacteroidaceae bacterium]